jgi:hypothetical protein
MQGIDSGRITRTYTQRIDAPPGRVFPRNFAGEFVTGAAALLPW